MMVVEMQQSGIVRSIVQLQYWGSRRILLGLDGGGCDGITLRSIVCSSQGCFFCYALQTKERVAMRLHLSVCRCHVDRICRLHQRNACKFAMNCGQAVPP